MPEKSITCFNCGITSYHPKYIEHRWCDYCKHYHRQVSPRLTPEHRRCGNRAEVIKSITEGTPAMKIARLKRAGILDDEGNLSAKYQQAKESRFCVTMYPVILHWFFHRLAVRWMRKVHSLEVEWEQCPTDSLWVRGYRYKVSGTKEDITNFQEKRMTTSKGNSISSSGSGTVTVNGKVYRGNSVRIDNDVVYIDGKIAEDMETPKDGILKVKITGDVRLVKCDRSVIVNGTVTGDVDAGSSVTCGNVGGSVDAGSSVACANVGGDVEAGSSVSASRIMGSVDAGSSVVGI